MGFGDQMVLDTEPVDEDDDGASDGGTPSGMLDFDTELVDDSDCVGCAEEDGVGVDLVVVDSEEDEASGNHRCVVGLLRECGDGASASNKDIEKEGVLDDTGFEKPVDLSQANALHFVDQFLSSNRVECSPLVEPGEAVRKVSPDSRSSGSQTLARYIMSRTKERQSRAFEWDDNDQLEERELVCGGMNASSDSRWDKNKVSNQNVSEIQKRWNSSDNPCRNVADSDHETKCIVNSSSRDAENMEGKKRVLDFVGKYAERRSEKLNSVASDHQLGKLTAETISLETNDAGFSTQRAAEVMEALSHGHPKYDCPGPQSFFQEYQTDVGEKQVDFGKLSVRDCSFPIMEGISTVPKRNRSKVRRGTNKFIWKHCSFRAAAEFPETAKNPRELLTKYLSDNKTLLADQSLARKFIVYEEIKEPVVEQENHQSPLKTNVSLGKHRVQVNPFNQGNGDEKNDSKLMRTREEFDGHRERRKAVPESPLITYRRKKVNGKQQVLKNSRINWNEMREDGSTKTIFRSNEQGERRNAVAESPLITYRRKKSLAEKQVQVNAQMNWNEMTDNRSTRPICRSDEHEERMNRARGSPIITYKRKRKQSEVSNAGLKLSGQSSEVDMSLQNQEKKISMDNTAITCLLDLHTRGRTKRENVCHSLPCLNRTGNNGDKSRESKMEDCHEGSKNNNIPKVSLPKELIRPVAPGSAHNVILKDIRKRRSVRVVSVLFSQHLDDSILKQQKRISSRMRIPVAPCVTNATHFIANRFARTRNMLEAIALGKPVVTHLWLESCCQVGCLIDEKNYILRDAKKEKEFGFSLPVSLSRALQHPLLKDINNTSYELMVDPWQGLKVLVTPNVKPSRDTIWSLVKAAHGEIVEDGQIKAAWIPAQILILSCEEDYAICLPFLEQGAAAYSPELILNGTIIQKLEYDRHQLFRHYMKH